MPSLPDGDFCVGCFTDNYPMKIGEPIEKNRLE
jgi:hypothetical protein